MELNERRSDRLQELNIAPAFFGVVTDALHRLEHEDVS
jgi:hypothetical protein